VFQLYCRGSLVDLLAARAGAFKESFRDVGFKDCGSWWEWFLRDADGCAEESVQRGWKWGPDRRRQGEEAA